MQIELTKVLDKIQCNAKRVNSKDEFEELVKIIVDYLNISKLKSYYPNYSQGTYLENQIKKFVVLLYNELELSNKNLLLTIEGFIGYNSIPIMTIQKSKGLEYSVVYFIGLEDSAFWNFRNQPEEYRCAFFVALSRAKTSVSFTFCKYRSQLGQQWQKHDQVNEFFSITSKTRYGESD